MRQLLYYNPYLNRLAVFNVTGVSFNKRTNSVVIYIDANVSGRLSDWELVGEL